MSATVHQEALASVELLNAQHVAKILGCSPRKVFWLNSCGCLPRPIPIGSLVRWRKQEIENWLLAGAPPLNKWETIVGTHGAS